MEDARYIGNKIRKIRKARGLTQTELGRMVNLPPERIQRYESGDRKMKPEMIQEVADALGVNYKYFTCCPPESLEDVMFSLFDISEKTNIFISTDEDECGRVTLVFDNLGLNEELKRWRDAKQLCEGNGEYDLWKSGYSYSYSLRSGDKQIKL